VQAICIPSSVEKICEYCFNGCKSLSTTTFEPDSKLSCIEGSAFGYCSCVVILNDMIANHFISFVIQLYCRNLRSGNLVVKT
jgi:hypothetical protein